MKRFVLCFCSFVTLLLFFSTSTYSQITGDDTVCVGEINTYTAPSGGSAYVWTLLPGSNASIITSSGNSAIVNFTVSGSELLTVKYFDPVLGSNVTYNLVISIFDGPNPVITWLSSVACIDTFQDGAGQPQPDKGSVCITVCDSSVMEFLTPNNPGSTYLWKSKNGTIVGGINTNSNVFVLWDQLGQGFLRVIETNVYGCIDSTEICIDVIEGPDADFDKPKTTLCLNEKICFDNLSVGAVNYVWDFGDGNQSFAFEPCHSYSAPGTYTITLVAINECWCTDTIQCDITVDPSEGPEIECISTVCAGDCVTYSTPESCATYNWYVPAGEGTIISGLGTNTIEVCWGNGPVGHICLEVLGCTSGTLCPDTVCYEVPIIPPTLNINGPVLVCQYSDHEYSIPCFPGAKVDWTVTGGNIISGDSTATIEVGWGAGPTGTISVTVTHPLLGCSSSGNLTVAIRPEFIVSPDVGIVCPNTSTLFTTFLLNFLPTGGTFDWTVTNSSNTVINFTPGVTGGSYTETWNFGTGTFYVVATPTNPLDFCTPSFTSVITVVNVPPADTIIGDTIVCPGTPTVYTALSPTSGTHFVWSATNGVLSSVNSNPTTVTWNLNSGPYVLTVVRVLDAFPNCTSAVYTLNVDSFSVPPPIVSGSGACVNQSSSFSIPSVPGALIYNWTISPASMGSIINGQGSTGIIVQWNNASGPVTVSVSTDICNHTVTGSTSVNIDSGPSISVADDTYCENSTGSLTVTPSAGLTFAWAPAPAAGQTTPTAIGLTQGTYTVSATNVNGCASIASAYLKENPAPIAHITTPNPTHYCIPDPVNSTLYATTGAGYTYNWSGGTSPTSAINTVTSANVYTVTVTGPGPDFCQATASIVISQDSCLPDTGTPCIPAGNPVIDFTVNSTPQCNYFTFTNNSNGSNYSWNFGDPNSNVNSGTLPNAAHTYTVVGYHTVTLTGDYPNSNPPPAFCQLSVSRTIQVLAVADLEVVTGCVGANTVFNDLSTFFAGTSITGWSWSFPGGVPSSASGPGSKNIVYNSPGSYSATLTVTHSSGCTSTKTIGFTIDPLPNAAFTFAPPTACIGDPILFTHSFPSGIINWNWVFPSSTSGATNTWYTFSSGGLQNVSLTVTNSNGCSNSSNQNIFVNTPITGPIMPNKAVIDTCDGDSMQLTAPAGSAWQWSTGETTQIIYAKTTGLYSVTVTDINGCDFIPDPIFVIIHPLPNAVISGPNDVCEFDNFSLLGPVGGSSYTWIKIGTGVVGSSISLSVGYLSPGLHQYQLIVVDINGCRNTGPIHNVIVHPKPFVFVIPPPDVCEGDPLVLTANGSGGTSPYSYNWSNGGNNMSTTVYLDGFYAVTLTDANGCTAEASVPVNVNPLPDFCLLPIGCLETCLPDTICGPVSPTPGYYATYEWLQLDASCNPIAVVSTNQNFIVTAPGKYALAITTNTFPVCTDTSAPMEIEELECNDSCYASYDSAFKQILNDITISTSTVFSGKYFVDDNVIITVTNGATLDLTNVDMVFGKCAGIDFLNGAIVRANNSVFRPCNLSESWRGFEFRTGSGGIIDECVFKNAQRAVIFWGSNAQPTDARVMNNFFYNCKMNVVSVFGNFREPVTGNTFIVESTNIQYDNSSCPVYIPYTGQHWGVIGYFSDFQANVSHNDFIHASDPNNSKKFIGVYLVQGSGIFSENKFTNMYRSFDLQRARNSSIENNEIEVTQQFTSVQNQIRGTDCTNMFVLSNEIENTFEYRSFVLNSSAIYFSKGSGLKIKENTIQGYSNGIVLISTTSAQIIENNIFNANQNGIYLDKTSNTDVACNFINMDEVLNGNVDEIGIVHLQNTLTPSNNVYRNNCILETDVAMYFSAPLPPAGAAPAQLPSILNNYMYSYTDAGIRVINFNGSIGTAAGSFANAGRNTFISNNVPNGTPDIESNVYTLNEAGNFGINLLVLVNSLGPKNAYHSTASCGHQIENNLQGITPNPGQEITAVERCDPYVNSTLPAKLVYSDDVKLNEDFVSGIEAIEYVDRLSILIDLLSILSDNESKQEINLLQSSVLANSLLNTQDYKWFEFYYFKNIADYVQANALLNYVPLRDKDEINLKLIESVLMDLAITGKDFHKLDAYRKMQLTMIDNERGRYASLARDILNVAVGGHSYIFEDLEKSEEIERQESDLLMLIDNSLEVFPNPFEDNVSITYYVNDLNSIDIKLYDISGKEISNYSWKYSGAKIELDMSRLGKGAYMIVVYNDDAISSRAKLIKQ